MKKFKVLLFVAAASLFGACDDAIDITQPSELLPEDTYETVRDMQLGLNGVYRAIPGEDQIFFTSLFTDEVRLGRSNGGQGTDGQLGFILNNNSGDAATIWSSNYYAINLANRLIEGAKNVTPVDEAEEVTYKAILAQAYYARAFAHFQLLNYFSPNMEDDNSLGVILVDYVPNTKQKMPRNTTGEVFALIESDLDFAEENLTVSEVVYPDRAGISPNAINAFRARMAAYRGKYAEAKGYVDLIGANPALSNNTVYPNIFRQNNQAGELIWKLERTVTGPVGNFSQYWSSVNSTITGSPFFEVSTALFAQLPAGDIRRSVVIDPTAATVGFAIRPIGKYATSQSQNLLGDVIVFRNAEMRLIKAEYYASISNYAGVATEINFIRRTRFGNQGDYTIATPTTDQGAWAAILAERRVELAFEGHRYIDIKRLGKKANVTVDRASVDFQWNQAFTLENTSYKFTLPIPRLEQAANPSIQQNPEYGNN